MHPMIFNLDRIEPLRDMVAMVLFAPIVDGDHLRAASGEVQGEESVRSANIEHPQSPEVERQSRLIEKKGGVVSARCEQARVYFKRVMPMRHASNERPCFI